MHPSLELNRIRKTSSYIVSFLRKKAAENFATFTFYKFLPQNMTWIFSHLRALPPKRTGQKQRYSKMASELKINSLHSPSKENYDCNQCGFSCNRPSSLKTHMLIHSGEKPFVCVQCNFSCTTASNLRRHKRTQTHSG